MTRDDLIRAMVDRHDHVSYKVMCQVVKQLTDMMMQSLHVGSRIEIRGFGSFTRSTRLPRMARNPATGTLVHTTKKFSVRFKPGQELRKRVDNAFDADN